MRKERRVMTEAHSKKRTRPEGTTPIMVHVPNVLHWNLKLLSIVRKETMNDMVVKMIDQFCSTHAKGIKPQ